MKHGKRFDFVHQLEAGPFMLVSGILSGMQVLKRYQRTLVGCRSIRVKLWKTSENRY